MGASAWKRRRRPVVNPGNPRKATIWIVEDRGTVKQAEEALQRSLGRAERLLGRKHHDDPLRAFFFEHRPTPHPTREQRSVFLHEVEGGQNRRPEEDRDVDLRLPVVRRPRRTKEQSAHHPGDDGECQPCARVDGRAR